nr:epithelial-stromal interaction protein 1 isoform X3 [Taeniopygia guttata]
MSGMGGWREGSRYRTATSFNTPSSSPGNPWHGNNEKEKSENTQKLTASEEKQGGQASVHQQQQKQYVGPYVLVTPNETRRIQLQQIAKKELDDLEQWKKEHRPGPITLVPQRLGGNESEAQVRQNQQMILMQSKYQKKHKREEYVKAKKAAEEAEILKKKAIQREKKRSHAYKQALRDDENKRLEEMRQEQQRKAELLEFKQKQEEETRTRSLKNEQRRVNNAFLDRLQNKTQPNNMYYPGYTGLPQ